VAKSPQCQQERDEGHQNVKTIRDALIAQWQEHEHAAHELAEAHREHLQRLTGLIDTVEQHNKNLHTITKTQSQLLHEIRPMTGKQNVSTSVFFSVLLSLFMAVWEPLLNLID
jgi:hypothetical protein